MNAILAPNDPRAAMQRLKRRLLLGLAAVAGLAVASVFLAFAALEGQGAAEREYATILQEIRALPGDVLGPEAAALLAAKIAAADALAERQDARRNGYRLLQAGIFGLTLILLAAMAWRLPSRLRQLRAAVQRLEEEHGRWKAIYDCIGDALLLIDPGGRILSVNPGAEAMFGYRADEIKGRSLQVLLPEPERSRFDQFLPAFLNGSVGHELLLLDREGQVIATEADVSPIPRADARQFLLRCRDVSGRKAQEEEQNEVLFLNLLQDLTEKENTAREMTRRANTDPLTGAYNRAKFNERLETELSRAQRGASLTLIMLDIDKFKSINDTYGHPTGDQVLNEIATVARNHLRSADLFARWGGEEFVILAPDTDHEGGTRLAEKIRASIERHPFTEVGRVTASLGATQYRLGEPTEAFIRRADEALYQAKHGGRNRVVAA